MMFVRGRMGRISSLGSDVYKRLVTFRLLVKDFKERVFPNVEFEIVRHGVGEMILSGKTDGNGTAVVDFETSAPEFLVRVYLPEGMVMKSVSVTAADSEPMVVKSLQEAPQVLLNTMEMLAGGTGLALILIGLLSRVTLVERIGETAVMATVFYRVGRAVI